MNPECPTCHAMQLRLHCPDSTLCDWVLCVACGSYGKADGTRWVGKESA